MAASALVCWPAALAQTAAVPAPAVPARAAVPTRPPSLLDQAAAPAVVELNGGQLTIRATNSSLRAILDDLEQRDGVKVEGLSRDERIFGVYGPGNPQEVLSALLDDSGYNVLISGRKGDGSPREILLSTRTASALATPAATRTQAADEEEDADPPEAQPVPPPPPPPSAPGPAANGAPQVKTPQQMLEELQRMRQTAGGQASAPQQ